MVSAIRLSSTANDTAIKLEIRLTGEADWREVIHNFVPLSDPIHIATLPPPEWGVSSEFRGLESGETLQQGDVYSSTWAYVRGVPQPVGRCRLIPKSIVGMKVIDAALASYLGTSCLWRREKE